MEIKLNFKDFEFPTAHCDRPCCPALGYDAWERILIEFTGQWSYEELTEKRLVCTQFVYIIARARPKSIIRVSDDVELKGENYEWCIDEESFLIYMPGKVMIPPCVGPWWSPDARDWDLVVDYGPWYNDSPDYRPLVFRDINDTDAPIVNIDTMCKHCRDRRKTWDRPYMEPYDCMVEKEAHVAPIVRRVLEDNPRPRQNIFVVIGNCTDLHYGEATLAIKHVVTEKSRFIVKQE